MQKSTKAVINDTATQQDKKPVTRSLCSTLLMKPASHRFSTDSPQVARGFATPQIGYSSSAVVACWCVPTTQRLDPECPDSVIDDRPLVQKLASAADDAVSLGACCCGKLAALAARHHVVSLILGDDDSPIWKRKGLPTTATSLAARDHIYDKFSVRNNCNSWFIWR